MQSVTIIAKNIEGYDEPLELEVQLSSSIEEIYSPLKETLQDHLQEGWPQFGQVVFYLQSEPTVKLPPSLILADIQKRSEDMRLAVIFPKNDLPIIQVSLNNLAYYYVEDYNKNQLLYRILQKHEPAKAIIKNSQYQEIIINKKIIDLSKQRNNQMKNYIEGYKNSIVKILIKTKEPQDLQYKEEEIKPAKQQRKNNNPPQQQKKEQIGNQRPPKPNQQVKKVEQNQSKNQIPDKQSINLIIKFQSFSGGSTGRQEISITVSNSSTLLSLLPSIITQLKSKGFDWDEEGYDHKRDSDKLNIVYESTQFKKLDKPFKSLINLKQIIFTFERHYEGGTS